MGTEVLRPHDCLPEWMAMVYPRRKNAYNNNSYQVYSHPPKPSRIKPAPARENQKKKASESSSSISRRYSSDDLRQAKHIHNHNHNQNPQITILKRGEPLDLNPPAPKARSGNRFVVSGTERLGPDPVVLKKQIRFRDPKSEVRSRSLSPKPVAVATPAMYAGSAFSVSPAPESLPLPTFSTKKQVSVTVDDSATRDLRRLLRLD